MAWYCVQADCPIQYYEGKDEFEAMEKYSQNYRVDYKHLTAVVDKEMTEKAEREIEKYAEQEGE